VGKIEKKDSVPGCGISGDAVSEAESAEVMLVTVDMMVKTLLDSAPLYVEIWEYKDGEFRFMDCNERAVAVFGVESKQEIMDLTFVDRPEFQPGGRDSTEMIYTTLSQVLKYGHGKAEFTLMNVAGEEMPFEFTYTRILTSDRQIIVCYGYDLREAIAAREEALEAEAQRVAAEIAAHEQISKNIRAMANAAPMYACVYDSDYNLIDFNKPTPGLFGVSSEEEFFKEVQKGLFRFSPEYQPCGISSKEKFHQIFAQAKLEGQTRFEWMYLTIDGAELPTEITLVKIDLSDSVVFVEYIQDLRPIREAEARRIADEIATIEREKQYKENILATISHEMRTPLAVMSVYAQMAVQQIKSGEITDEALDALNTISDEAHRLAGLANSALDMFTKKERDDTKADVDIGEMAVRLTNMLTSTAAKRNTEILLRLPSGLPPVWGVADQLTRVFWNVFDNALRHTKNGNITVSAKVEEGDTRFIHITVADTGEGMAADNLPRAFESGFTSGEGAGLGLAFCKEIIEAHGGGMKIETAEGEGFAVTFSLPEYCEAKAVRFVEK